MLRIVSRVRSIRSSVSCTSLLLAVALALVPDAYGATTVYVANNGVDSNVCGTIATPCRSITQAIANAAPGNTIVVGPGAYGDLNGNGLLGDTGEENPPASCRCILRIDKSVKVISSDGAASTIVGAPTVPNLIVNVSIDAAGVQFGAPLQGFTIPNTLTLAGQEDATYGISAVGDQVSIVGNRVVVRSNGLPFAGIASGAFPANTNTILIQGNQVSGWQLGIGEDGVNITISQNAVQSNFIGIGVDGGQAMGNVVTGNYTGITLYSVVAGARANGNAVLGNQYGFDASAGGTLKGNNIFGNGCGVYVQATVPPVVLADNNYWGAASGPGPDPADDLCGSGTSATTVDPVATKPFKVTLKATP
jgi:hypothetical protein